MTKFKIIALFGESSSGKDSIQNWIVNNMENFYKIISITTRPPRDYERDGKDYFFVPQKTFKSYIEDHLMLEYTCFNGWYYGTHKYTLIRNINNNINIGIFNPDGIRTLLTKSDIETLPVWIKANDKIRLLRSLNREQNPNCEEICRRFLTDKEDFSNIEFDYEIFLNNSDKDNYHGFFNRPKIKEFINSKND